MQPTKETRIIILSSVSYTYLKINEGIHFHDLNFELPDSSMASSISMIKTLNYYAQSKLANIYFMKKLAARCKNYGKAKIIVHAVHPGIVDTEIAKSSYNIVNYMIKCIRLLVLKSPTQGAQSTLFAAFSKHNICHKYSGLYFDNCISIRTKRYNNEKQQIEKLWEISKEYCGVDLKF